MIRVTHVPVGEELALKLLLPETATSLTVHARFLREAQSAVRLTGEHVARILDVGVMPDGVPYMVTEAARGVDLAGELARRAPLTPGEAVDYALQVCEALAEAHEHGIVHRDLKPGNVFLIARPDRIPLVKVANFGIAQTSAGASTPLARPDSVIGTPGYMAPEQLKATEDLDGRADIWAVGVLIYECLAGVRPFPADARSVIAEPPRPLDFRIPGALQATVLRCLEKNREARFPSVAALAAALAPFAYDQQAAAVVLSRVNRMPQSVSTAAPPPAPVASPVVSPPSVVSGVSPRARRRTATIAAVALAASIGGISAAALIMPGRSRIARGPSQAPASMSAREAAASPDASLPVAAAAAPSAASPGAASPAAASPTASNPAAASPSDFDKRQKLGTCTELEAQRAWRALADCAAELGKLGVADRAEQLRATARQELQNQLHDDKLQQALRAGNLKDAQAALREIGAGSVYLAGARDRFTRAEQERSDEARHKAQELASAHDCAGLQRLIAQTQLSATGTERVVAAAQAVACNEAPVAAARPAARPAPPPSQPAVAVAPAPHKTSCETVNVEDVMTRAAIQYDSGAASSALSLARVALGCKQTDRMYWLAVMYACAAHDLTSARQYFPKVPSNLQSGIERKCQQEDLDVRTR